MTPIEVDVATVHQLQKDKSDMVLIDCREEKEYQVAKIPDAVLMPMSDWQNQIPKLDAFQGKRVIVHCHHGGRSLRIASWLRENGFPDAQSMAGGIEAWSNEVDESVARY